MSSNSSKWNYIKTRPVLSAIIVVSGIGFGTAGLLLGEIGGLASIYTKIPVPFTKQPGLVITFLLLHFAIAAYCAFELWSLSARGTWPGEKPRRALRQA